MPTEYQSLAISCVFFLLAFLPASYAKLVTYGFGYLASSRTRKPVSDLPDWGKRAENAHNNLKDNLPGFIAAVLLLGLMGKLSETTQILAAVYVLARIAHFVIYLIGLKTPRTLAYTVGLVSNLYLLLLVLL
jgi:uncharacterized MAPEG superfamily protein